MAGAAYLYRKRQEKILQLFLLLAVLSAEVVGAGDHAHGVQDGAHQEGAAAVHVVQIVHGELLIVVDDVVVHNKILTFVFCRVMTRSVCVYTRPRQVLQFFEKADF